MKIVCIWCFLVGAAVATSSKFTHSLRGKPDAASNSSGVIPSERLRRMKAVVINLRKREDRWNAFRETVAEHAPWLQVERLDAVNASVEPPSEEEVAKVWSTARLAKLFSSYRAVTVAMSPGERGCAASHLKAWRLCASGSDPILVFEDDAKLSLAFTGILEQAMQEAPDDLGAIWLSNMDRGADPINVDPEKLEAFDVELGEHSEPVSCDSQGFQHQDDWVDRVCEQMLLQRFALISFPRKYSRLYHRLLESQMYPPQVRDRRSVLDSRGVASDSDGLPGELLAVSDAWARVCEHVCKHVACSLQQKTSSVARSDKLAEHQTYGMLRISYNSSAGPHFDNSFVTLMGAGTVRGALQFGHRKSDAEADSEHAYLPCEDFFPPNFQMNDPEGLPFFMFAGVQAVSPFAKDYSPLFHRVDYGSGDEDNVDRINAIYFVRRYERGEHRISEASLEIHAFSKTILADREFVKCVPDHVKEASQSLAVTGVVSEASTGASTGEEDAYEEDNFYWGDDGLP